MVEVIKPEVMVKQIGTVDYTAVDQIVAFFNHVIENGELPSGNSEVYFEQAEDRLTVRFDLGLISASVETIQAALHKLEDAGWELSYTTADIDNMASDRVFNIVAHGMVNAAVVKYHTETIHELLIKAYKLYNDNNVPSFEFTVERPQYNANTNQLAAAKAEACKRLTHDNPGLYLDCMVYLNKPHGYTLVINRINRYS